MLVARPEHWHHRISLDALAAGKDVYIEKPLCRTPEGGVELMLAEAATKQMVQAGMRRRSYDPYLESRQVLASGKQGSARMVRSWWPNNYIAAGRPAKVEGALDWEQWQGPIA